MRTKRRVQNSLLRALATRLKEKRALALFRHLAERFRVDEVVADGARGRIQGKLDDEIVFARYLREGTWSPDLVAFLAGCFEGEAAGTFLDIGANIGLVTLGVAASGPIDCVCFEPEPENLALLRANVARSGLGERIEILPLALYREETTLELEIAGGNRGDHRIRAGAAEGIYDEASRAVIRVPGRPLDDVVDAATRRRPLVMKCDAQGAELDIWAGGAKTFAQADALVIEFWPYGLRRMGGEPEDLVARLAADFERGQLVPRGAGIRPGALVPMEEVAEALRAFCREAPPAEHADVVATSAELAERLAAAGGLSAGRPPA